MYLNLSTSVLCMFCCRASSYMALAGSDICASTALVLAKLSSSLDASCIGEEVEQAMAIAQCGHWGFKQLQFRNSFLGWSMLTRRGFLGWALAPLRISIWEYPFYDAKISTSRHIATDTYSSMLSVLKKKMMHLQDSYSLIGKNQTRIV